MTQNVEIREALWCDLAAISEIWLQGVAQAIPGGGFNVPADTMHHFEMMLRNLQPPFRVWVATNLNGHVIGWQSLLPCRNNLLLRVRMAESSTYVRRRNGIPHLGRLLLEHALHYAETTELQYVIGFVGAENSAAIKMVKLCNFTMLGTFPAAEKEPFTGEVLCFCKVIGLNG